MQEMVHKEQLKGHKAVVMGAGRSGLSAAALLTTLGAGVRLLEKRTDFDGSQMESRGLLDVELIQGEHRQEHFQGADLVVVSPGISMAMVRGLCPEGQTVISELELASWFISEPVIAVTGTNGKTTTCMLIQKVLEKAGRKVFTGGNIGTPLSDHVLSGKRADILVLEVSSFQLQGCSGFAPHVGVLLNFSANHLDHHENENEYFRAKMQLFARQSPMDLAVLPLELREKVENDFRVKSNITYFAPTGRFHCPALPGAHNQANMEAAMLACGFVDVSRKVFDQALLEFVPPPHRQEVFLQNKGVHYINDSKATTLEAMAAALKAFDAPIRLLAGGRYKGGDFSLLAGTLQEKAAKVYLFGDSREIFEDAWKNSADMEHFPDLEQAAARAVQEAGPGDNVLLSPGTSSFDLFSNYQERGEAFKKAVRKETGITLQ